MPPNRNAAEPRSRSRGRKARSTSRSRGRKAPTAAAAVPVIAAAQPVAVTPVFNGPKETMPTSMWKADARLMDAMSSGRSHVHPTGARNLFHGKEARVWGYWAAIIVFQVIAIVWAKWAIDMYKQYRDKVH